MNERIKELIEQARKKPMGDSWCYTSPKEFELKLAELIVKECVGIVETLPPGYKDYRDQIEDAFRRCCIEDIKKHFGVE